MSVRFNGQKKALSFAKSIKKRFDVSTLTEAKNIAAYVCGYSNWEHLCKEVKSPSSEHAYISKQQIPILRKKLNEKIDTDWNRRDCEAFLAEELSLNPDNASELEVFLYQEDMGIVSLMIEASTRLAEDDECENDKQSRLDLAMEVLQATWMDHYFLRRAALYFHLATVHNCARAQVHIGRMLIQGCLGFTDSEQGIALMLKGLDYRTRVSFSDDIFAANSASKSDFKYGCINDWATLLSGIVDANPAVIPDGLNKGLRVVDRIEGLYKKVGSPEQLNSTISRALYDKAVLNAMKLYIETDKKLDAEDLIESLIASANKGYEVSLKVARNYLAMLDGLKRGSVADLPVKDAGEWLVMLCSEITGAFIPKARVEMVTFLSENAIEDSIFYHNNPEILEASLSLLARIPKDIERWPDQKEDWLNCAANIVANFCQHDLRLSDEVLRIGQDLVHSFPPSESREELAMNVATGLSQHAGPKAVIAFVEPLLPACKADKVKLPHRNPANYLLSSYVQAHFNLFKMEGIESMAVIEHLKSVCETLMSRNHYHSTFQLIYGLRSIDANELPLPAKEIYKGIIDWVETYVTRLMLDTYSPSRNEEPFAKEKVLMEYAVILLLNGQTEDGFRYLEIASYTYPSAEEAFDILIDYGVEGFISQIG